MKKLFVVALLLSSGLLNAGNVRTVKQAQDEARAKIEATKEAKMQYDCVCELLIDETDCEAFSKEEQGDCKAMKEMMNLEFEDCKKDNVQEARIEISIIRKEAKKQIYKLSKAIKKKHNK
jgi:hypothetical protein